MPIPSIMIDFLPDWSDEPELSYSLFTAVQETPYYVEQRRPLLDSLYDLPARTIKCKFTESNESMQRLRNLLHRAKASSDVAAPIYTDPMQFATIPQGGDHIEGPTADLTDFYDIWHCGYIMLYDLSSGAAEVCEVDVVDPGDNSIWINGTIAGSYDPDTCIIFPVIVAYIKQMKESMVNAALGSYDVEFEEIFLPGPELEVWRGILAQTCCGLEETET